MCYCATIDNSETIDNSHVPGEGEVSSTDGDGDEGGGRGDWGKDGEGSSTGAADEGDGDGSGVGEGSDGEGRGSGAGEGGKAFRTRAQVWEPPTSMVNIGLSSETLTGVFEPKLVPSPSGPDPQQ